MTQTPEETPLPFEEHVLTELAVLRGCLTALATFAGASDPLADYPVARRVRGLSSVAVETELTALHADVQALGGQLAANWVGTWSDTQQLREELRRLDEAVADRVRALTTLKESLADASRGEVKLVSRDASGDISVIQTFLPNGTGGTS